jgi:hypothetical protein
MEARDHAEGDPAASLFKSRSAMEKILARHYIHVTGQPAKDKRPHEILQDERYKKVLPERIACRLHFIRRLCNLGVHQGEVYPEDARLVLSELLTVLEWKEGRPFIWMDKEDEKGGETSLEMIGALRDRFGDWIRSELTSVRFVQSECRCWLVETSERIGDDGVVWSVSEQKYDLGFITNDFVEDDWYFSPRDPIQENVRKFLEDFGGQSIAMCTSLFTDEGGDQAWEEARMERGGEDLDCLIQ